MRVLLDESLPRPLAKQIIGHDARTVSQMKWTSLGNGELLKQAAAAFDVLLTADQNSGFNRISRRCLWPWSCSSRTATGWNPWSRSSLRFFKHSKPLNLGL